MNNFGWSYPAGCTGTPYDEGDDAHCARCGVELAEEDPGVPNPLAGLGGQDVFDSVWQDGYCSCRCFLAAGEIRSQALPMPVVRGLARREPDYSVEAFCQYIGCGETLRENLRAIDKHCLEHVWLVLMDGRTVYYHSHDILDTLTGKETVRAVGAGCIAWDGSDWETAHVIELRDEGGNDHGDHWGAVDAARTLCHEDYDVYIAER